jgi:hypothetical protein
MVRLLRGRSTASPSPDTSRTASTSTTSPSDRRGVRAPADGVFNIVDDEPASPSDQIAFAAHLIGIEPPPETSHAEAYKILSPLAASFYEGCIRARNDKLKAVLGVKLRYPNYREGLRALYQAGDHLAAAHPAAPG